MKRLALIVLLLAVIPVVSAGFNLNFNETWNRASCIGDCWANNWVIIANTAEWSIINNSLGFFNDDSTSSPEPEIRKSFVNISDYRYYILEYNARFMPNSGSSGSVNHAQKIILKNFTNHSIFTQTFTGKGTDNGNFLGFTNETGNLELLRYSPKRLRIPHEEWIKAKWVIDSQLENMEVYINGVLNMSNLTLENYNLSQTTSLTLEGLGAGSGFKPSIYYDNMTFLSSNGAELNFTFYDENTRILLTNTSWVVTNNVNESFNGTGNNVTINGLLGNYEIQYFKDSHFLRRYYISIPSFNFFTNISLYSINKSKSNAALITYTITDENGVPLNDATLKVLRFYPEINQELIVEMSKSDVNGEGGIHLEKIDPEYSFVVEYLGNTVLTTGRAQIFSDDIVLRVGISEDVLESLTLVTNIKDVLSYDNDTRTFTLTWNDPTNTLNSVCLNVTRLRGLGISVINESCSTSAAGSISLGHPDVNGVYRAFSRIETNTANSPHGIALLEIAYSNVYGIVGNAGTLYTVFIIIALSMGGLFITKHYIGVLIGGIFGYVASGLMGLVEITPVAVIFSIIIAGIIIFGARKGV